MSTIDLVFVKNCKTSHFAVKDCAIKKHRPIISNIQVSEDSATEHSFICQSRDPRPKYRKLLDANMVQNNINELVPYMAEFHAQEICAALIVSLRSAMTPVKQRKIGSGKPWFNRICINLKRESLRLSKTITQLKSRGDLIDPSLLLSYVKTKNRIKRS